MSMSTRTPLYLPAVFFLLTIAACGQGCRKPEQARPKAENAKAEGFKELPSGKKEAERIEEFPTLDFSGLSQAQTEALVKVFNDEICPCGCPRTFAQCLLQKSGCRPGQLLAQWAVLQAKLGTPERMLLQAISEEINSGFLAAQKSIDTKGAYHKGNKSAPITIVEFADFECPSCKFAAKQFREFMKSHPNDVQAYFMHFPLSTHPHAEAAAIAAEAAGLQGKFWEMHDLLFAHDGALSEAVIQEIAAKIFNKTELAKFNKDIKNEALKTKVSAQKEYAVKYLDLMATPTFYVNGRPYNLSFAKDGFEVRIAMEQARSQIDCQAK